jgi:hypothetical protein
MIACLTGREIPRVALHLTVFEQPEKDDFFSSPLAERIEEDDSAPNPYERV